MFNTIPVISPVPSYLVTPVVSDASPTLSAQTVMTSPDESVDVVIFHAPLDTVVDATSSVLLIANLTTVPSGKSVVPEIVVVAETTALYVPFISNVEICACSLSAAAAFVYVQVSSSSAPSQTVLVAVVSRFVSVVVASFVQAQAGSQSGLPIGLPTAKRLT